MEFWVSVLPVPRDCFGRLLSVTTAMILTLWLIETMASAIRRNLWPSTLLGIFALFDFSGAPGFPLFLLRRGKYMERADNLVSVTDLYSGQGWFVFGAKFSGVILQLNPFFMAIYFFPSTSKIKITAFLFLNVALYWRKYQIYSYFVLPIQITCT